MKRATPRVRSLLRQAKRTEEINKRAAARELYEQIVEEAPATVDAWLGLARLADDTETKEAALRQVLELDPDNRIARQGLNGNLRPLESALQQAAPEKPAPPPPRKAPRREQEQAKVSAPAAAERTPPQPAPATEATELELLGADGDVATETFCYRHPDRSTRLRCYTCNRPICISCAKRTPVGYRCPQCVRELEDTYYSAGVLDYLLAGVVSLILGVIGGYIAAFLAGIFIFILIFVGPAIGALIGRAAFRAAGRRRGRFLPYIVAGMVVFGGLIPVLPALLVGQFGLFTLLVPGLYGFLAAASAFYQVK